jgi:hypothetical protein
MGALIRVGLAVFLATAGIAAASAQKPAPEDDPEFGAQKLGRIEAFVGEVVALRDAAARQGQAIRLSCIGERLKRLRALTATARRQADTWPRNYSDPAQRSKSAAEINELEVKAKALTAEAHACVEVRPDELQVEVTHEGNVPDLPPSDTVPPPNFERPPLASPY